MSKTLSKTQEIVIREMLKKYPREKISKMMKITLYQINKIAKGKK